MHFKQLSNQIFISPNSFQCLHLRIAEVGDRLVSSRKGFRFESRSSSVVTLLTVSVNKKVAPQRRSQHESELKEFL